MSDVVVVYESNELFWTERVKGSLQEEGFHAEFADDAGGAYYRMHKEGPGAFEMDDGGIKFRVVVPRQEEAAARLFLRKRDEQFSSRVAEQTDGLRQPLLLSALAAAVASIIFACLGGELVLSLLLALIFVFPASFLFTASAFLSHNTIGQICALIITVATVTGGFYCVEQALIWIGCSLLCIPGVGMVYIFLHAYKVAARIRKKKESLL